MEPKVLPAIGTEIIAKYIPSITNTSSDMGCTGQRVRVISTDPRRFSWDNAVSQASGDASFMPSVYAMFNTTAGGTIHYQVTDWDVVDPDVIPEPDYLAAVIIVPTIEDSLRSRVTELTALLDTQRRQAIDSFLIVSDRLIAEAEARGWCDIFDNIVTDVNTETAPWLQLEVREREFELVTSITITMTLNATERATCIEDAINLAHENDLNSLIADQVRYGNYEIEQMDWEEN